MTYFRAVRIYATLEACIFTALLVVWIGGLSKHTQEVLGWVHGFGWIILCALVARGCIRRVFRWEVFAATVSPLGPIGATIGIEVQRRSAQVA
jgi:hypothetical protein